MARIGVFVCHCGENIGRTVDCARVAEELGKLPGVAHAVDYKYMCSDPGQALIKQAIAEKGLTGVVVSACSPHMHERTFRRAAGGAGLNPFLCEMANIREHCSWIHEDREAATDKAIDLARVIVEKVKRNVPLETIRIPVEKRALVIGGGIAGIQAALDLADGGAEVVLVEKEPSIGGHMSQLSETFPTLDCSQCILTPRMVEVYQHPRIRLMAYCEVDAVEGYIGNFKVTIRQKARSVDETKCNGCGACQKACVVKNVPSEFDERLGKRTAIYVPFPQAVPNIPVIDREHCAYFKGRARGMKKDACGKCKEACARGAIDFAQEDRFVTEKVGAIVVATGYELYSIGKDQPAAGLKGYGEYGYGTVPDVIDGLQFERLASASGPTAGKLLRPSDGKVPKKIVFLQCVGSRDPAKGIDYCSKVCCMYVAKHTMLYRHKVHDGEATVFYMDVRAAGKGYDEFTRRAVEEDGAVYVRGRVSRVYRDGDVVKVLGFDTLNGTPVEIDADMVVLATAMRPRKGIEKLAQTLSVSYDRHGFINEAHPKLRPVETNTAGVFVAGACQAPRDIPDSVAMASAAAAKVLGLFSNEMLEREPTVARVDAALCAGCFHCERVCPYGAVEHKEVRDRKGNLLKVVADVNPGVCQGCGTCQATCPSKSVELMGFTDEQIYAEVNALAL
ncbi:MAG TPA: CoB--CoM heterodisulfide reductase iron-sulfur subunit A family protein [Thermoanaerobaculia bacterium]|nr:CoB--CoM heterodisulfide reductase iron-sulfur subunit A family protein [Thermoanaerobaculia bacterium]HQN06122.1 CoB--CoM heterodisulfide reductase iron-sulfur subunit A family protein [Thermoanaerobaculia bacterium]